MPQGTMIEAATKKMMTIVAAIVQQENFRLKNDLSGMTGGITVILNLFEVSARYPNIKLNRSTVT
jgi:hypothetical protein